MVTEDGLRYPQHVIRQQFQNRIWIISVMRRACIVIGMDCGVAVASIDSIGVIGRCVMFIVSVRLHARRNSRRATGTPVMMAIRGKLCATVQSLQWTTRARLGVCRLRQSGLFAHMLSHLII